MSGYYSVNSDCFRNKYAVRNLLLFKDVYYCEADGSYTNVFDEKNEAFTLSYRIGKVQSKMNVSYIFRCHASYFVNLYHVNRIVRGTNGYTGYYVELTNAVRIKCSKHLVDKLDARLAEFRKENGII